MNNQLARLITDFQTSVKTAVILMQRSGIRMPDTLTEWFENDIPQSGNLIGGLHYLKHGAGCTVTLPTGEVDFDFGELGEIGGFDVWRLIRFAKDSLTDYGFNNKEEVVKCFDDELAAGSITYLRGCLYHITNVDLIFALDVDYRLQDDLLPIRSQDRVLVLYGNYFLTANLMRENYEKLRRKWNKTGKLNQKDKVKFGSYLSSWLGFLGVTCEGFKKLRMSILLQEDRPNDFKELLPMSDDIGKMMKKHSDSLRKFRNNVFHLRENSEVIRQFFAKDEKRLLWASELHFAIEKFFSEYRTMCEVHYIMNGRQIESNLVGKRKSINVGSELKIN